jgi:hypothetical protein
LAADYELLASKLTEFYNFAGKVVLLVGAGRGQLLGPAITIKRLIAVDQDLAALKEVEKKIAGDARQSAVELVHDKCENVVSHSDVVYFEFCRHEMANPFFALKRARTLAPDAVVFDHSPDSEWIYYSAEEEMVRRSAVAMKNFGIRRCSSFRAAQHFTDYAELYSKVSV